MRNVFSMSLSTAALRAVGVLVSVHFVCMALAAPAFAQWSPAKPVKLIIPYGAGGSADLTGRTVAEKVAAVLGQPIVPENRSGAGGIIGTDAGAKSVPDGYTWVMGSDAPFTINAHLQKLPYDPLKDLEAVSLMANVPLVLVVNPALPVKTLDDLIRLARSKPAQLTIGSNGNGSSGHLSAELLKADAKIDLVHVPYKGQPQVVTDVLGGQVNMTFSSLGPVEQHIKSGRLRAIAISVSKRFSGLPEVPTMMEAGLPRFDVSVWIGLLVPAGTPKPVIVRVNAEVTRALELPDVRERLTSLGYLPVGGAPSILAERIAQDHAKWGRLIREVNIRVE